MELVELLLADTPNWGHDAISQQLDSEKTRNVTLSQPVPIFIAYWTVDASAEGHISFKPDIYERDFKLLERLAQKR
jgi:murein L,D-transpeptidase YcbB/YkuD